MGGKILPTMALPLSPGLGQRVVLLCSCILTLLIHRRPHFMEKRYQVFVSSTYEDLREERQEVIQALLELDCIPSGMELFPAADEDQWSLIKKVIDDCDYYMVIIGGRYGSLGTDGKSYTQMEYEYALGAGKPIVAFIHPEPEKIESGKTEKTEEGRQLLNAFRELAKKKMVKSFSSPKDLGSVASRSIVQLIKAKPGIGWVRSNETVDGKAAQEILRLKGQVEQLQSELQKVATTTPAGAESLAQGKETHKFRFEVGFAQEGKSWVGTVDVELAWDWVFYFICPRLDQGDAPDDDIVKTLIYATRFIVPIEVAKVHKGATDPKVRGLAPTSLQTMLIQFKALGYISRIGTTSTTVRSWKLTPLGESKMNALYAILSQVHPPAETNEINPKNKINLKKAARKKPLSN